MIKKFSAFVGSNNASERSTDLEAYSYCSSETTKKSSLVLWPQTLEQVRRIMLIALNPVTTIGGMIALNAVTKESHGLGRMEKWIESAEFVDGTGKQYLTRKKELVLGKEGLTGFITRAKLRITEQPV